MVYVYNLRKYSVKGLVAHMYTGVKIVFGVVQNTRNWGSQCWLSYISWNY